MNTKNTAVTGEGNAPREIPKGDLLEAVAILAEAGVIDELYEIELQDRIEKQF